jgi:hypothetical protein
MQSKCHTGPSTDSGGEAGAIAALPVPLESAFRAIGVRRTKGYELVAGGHLILVKIGSKSLITAESLRRFAAGLPPTGPSAER